MARPIAVTAGPFAAASATNVVASQKAAGAQHLVLNGATGTSSAATVAASQATTGAQNLTINGSLAVGGIAFFATPQYVFFTDAANNSSITYTITGTMNNPNGGPPFGVTETVTASNASVVSSTNQYVSVSKIAASGATTGNVQVGTYGVATLDTARYLLFTDGGVDTGITFTVTGTDWAGSPISEKVTGSSGSTVATVLNYATVSSIVTSGAVATTITVGTQASGGVGYSQWVRFDEYSAMGPTAIQVNATTGATINWTVQQTLDDPNSTTNPVAVASMNWVNHPDTNLVNSTTVSGVQGNYAYPPVWARVVVNSVTGTTASATAKFLQNYQK